MRALISISDLPGLEFVHSDTFISSVLTTPDYAGPISLGQTTWATQAPDNPVIAVVISWKWIEIQPGVVAIDNMLVVSTNLAIVPDNGRDPLSPSQTAMYLHQIIHGLPWQQEVMKTIQAARERRQNLPAGYMARRESATVSAPSTYEAHADTVPDDLSDGRHYEPPPRR